MIEKSVDAYLEFLVCEYYNGLMILKESSYLDADELETIYAYGYNLFTYGKYEKAKEIFEILTREAPSDAYLWRALGSVNQQLKNYNEAIKAYSSAIENDENDIVSYVYRGESKIFSRKVKDALKDFKKVLKIGDPNLYKAWLDRSQFLIDIHSKLHLTNQINDDKPTEDELNEVSTEHEAELQEEMTVWTEEQLQELARKRKEGFFLPDWEYDKDLEECIKCGYALRPEWSCCPVCETPVDAKTELNQIL